MFIHKTLLTAALLVGLGGAYSLAGDTPKPKAAPMTANDQKLTQCEVHGTELHVENVPIRYGRPMIQEGFFEAQQQQFPHANTYVLGGCVIDKNSPRQQTVKFCDQCREAEKQWLEAHKGPQN